MNRYQSALNFIFSLIPKQKNKLFPAELGLLRMKHLMKQLNNPQDTIKTIHIAGTSGKGSTALIISKILKLHKFKIGLTISPHIKDIRERIQVDNKMISKSDFLKIFNIVFAAKEKIKIQKFKDISYFEFLIAMAFLYFKKMNCNYNIIETGLGGLYDGTNCINSNNKIAVITKIGLDHTEILGKTLKEIAFQKAGIIQNGNLTITSNKRKTVIKEIEKQVKKKHSKLIQIDTKNIKQIKNKIIFFLNNEKFEIFNFGLKGSFQLENLALSIAVCKLVSKRDKWLFDKSLLKNGLEKLNFPARFSITKVNEKIIVADGAHNPQKINTFFKSLSTFFPNEKFDTFFAVKKGKNFREMLKIVSKYSNNIYLSNFQISGYDLPQKSEDPRTLQLSLNKLGFYNSKIVSQKSIPRIICKLKNKIVFTGSFYFISNLIKNKILTKI